MIISPRYPRLISIAALLVFVFIAIFVYLDFPTSVVLNAVSRKWPTSQPSDIQPTNGTLGFGGIYVVSGPGSPRRDHLEQAAAVTELNLTIPDQISWTEQDIRDFRGPKADDSETGTGSIKAWLSHHLVLRAFLESGLETALIIENDVDWDIRLRTRQIPLTQRATRKLLPARHVASEAYPWGNSSDWDLLYLGTCGDYFGPVAKAIGVGHHHPEHLNNIPHIIFEDDSLPYFTDLHPWTASLLAAFRIPERNRVVHQSVFPLCSFGYAVTRQGAEKILNEVAPAKEELMPFAHAYDVALLNGCGWRNNTLRCYTVQPELFHHMPGASVIGKTEGNPFLAPADEKGMEQMWYRQETSNILCGFFSGAFYHEGNMEKLEYLREEVGRKGRCLKPGRD